MAEMKSLLTNGVGKLGEGIHSWNLPAVETCPGRTPTCERACYCNGRGRYRFQQVKDRLQWNLRQAERADFSDRMVAEIGKKGVQVLRLHSSGDFGTVDYAAKWLEVMRRRSRPRYYCYTRSWRCPDIAPVLAEMALLKCCRVWFSTDADTGMPPVIPPGVRLAFLQTEEGQEPELLDLRFAVRKLRKKRFGLTMLCPHEMEQKKVECCGSCGICYR